MNFTKKTVVKSALILFAFLMITGLVSAQNILNGNVTDASDGSPVTGAVVKINNSLLYSTTDASGNFSFKGLNATTYEITITHLAYEPKTISASTSADNNIKLERQTYLSDEITVNATRVTDQTGAAFNNIQKSDLEKNNLGQDLPLLLNNMPSVVVTSDAGNGVGYTGIRVRGNDPTRVNVTINGIPVNDAESHQVYWVDLPDIASSTDNIQLQRGLGSSTNGAGAFGASLNLQTTKISRSPYGTISSSVGSFNTNKNTVAFGTGVINDHFTIDGRLSMINSDGYVDRASSALQSFSLSGGYYNAKEFIRAVIISGKEKTYQSWNGIAEEIIDTNRTYNSSGQYTDEFGNIRYYDNQTDNYQQDYYQLFYSRTLSNSLTANFAAFLTRGEGYYEEFKEDASFDSYNLSPVVIGDSTIESTDIIRRKWLSNDYYGGTWSFNYENKKLNAKFGGAANRFVGRHYNEIISAGIFPASSFPYTYYDDTADKSDINFFLKTTYEATKKLAITIDLQERFVNYDFSKIIKDGNDVAKLSFFNPKAGLSYKFNSIHRFYFYVGAGHKELVRDDYLASTINTRPDAESMIDYEAGYNFTSQKLAVTINCYYLDYSNQLILTGKINESGEYIRENVKNSYRAGIEAEFKYQLKKNFYLAGNLTVSDNKIKSYTEYVDDYDTWEQVPNTYKNTTISFSPSVISSAELNYTLMKKIVLNLNTKYVGKQYLDNTKNENRKLDSYFLTNFSGSYTIPVKGLRMLQLKLMLNNILNEEYNANGYTYSGYISGERNDYNFYFPQAKMNWLAGVVVGF